MKPYRGMKDLFDLAAGAEVPLVVRRCCTPHQLTVWLALRVLLELRPGAAFGLRDIGHEANLTSIPRIAGWIDDLVKLGFLEIAGYEEVPNLARPRTVYRIPWKEIYEKNILEVERYLIQLGLGRAKTAPTNPHQRALELDPPVSEGSQAPVSEGSQGSVILRIQEDPSPCIRSITGACDPSDTHVRKEVSKESARFAQTDPEPDPEPDPPRGAGRPRTPPANPPGEPPLSRHPVDVVRAQTGRAPLQAHLFAQLAAEHDGPTGGYGWYWVGRALEAGVLAAGGEDQVRNWIALPRSILRRWRESESYGSDAPAAPRRPRTYSPSPAAPAGEKVSDLPILQCPYLTGRERAGWLERFRRADTPAAKQTVLDELARSYPPSAAAD